MNDAYYEQLVTRKPKTADTLVRVLCVALVAATAFFGMLMIGLLSFVVAVLIAFALYSFVFPRLNVEYEYTLVNHDVEISAIYNKASRKKKFEFDIQEAEIFAPKGSRKLDSYHPAKTLDFSSGAGDGGVYAVIIPSGQSLTCVLMEPDETMLNHLKTWSGSKFWGL